ncbi:MAG: hydantoinase/oxoprolinase family protein, partial [Bacteroidota bacterium]|nr:hydantoinase/oxoprolinase family protein [Bacteroidota bacterium]
MSENSFELNVDTGGTFTDCLTKDSEGNILRRKVLSNGSIRGSIIHWKNKLELKIQEQWKLEKDILAGYAFQLLNQKHPDIKLASFDPDEKILKLDKPLPEDLEGFKGGFELRTGEEAPVLAARLISECSLLEKIPVHKIRLGSTKGTNALLERKGSGTVFFVTKGFKDLLQIRYQQRSNIFARNIQKPIPLYKKVIEVNERIDAEGKIIEGIDLNDLKLKITALRREPHFDSAAVALLNSYKNPDHENILESILRETGFQFVSISSKLSSLIKYIPRAETTVVNAYLDTIIQNYLDNISEKIHVKDFFVMNSAGGLVRKGKFHPKDSLLSGPAGGVVGAAAIGKLAGYNKIISFDMGGTSTDVSRISEKFDYSFELEVGDAKIFSPALSIETVAAGGGSICYYDGFKLSVGPDSARAYPGPACYGAGGPLTITDINLLSGRLDPKQFGIPVFPDESLKRVNELIDEIFSRTGVRRKMEDLIDGFLQIANELMAGAIRKVSVSKGYKPADHVLVAFGGAGGMHASAIADLLHINTILLPRDAGLLSAYGISMARIERIAEKQVLLPYSKVIGELPAYFHELDELAMTMIMEEGADKNNAIIRERYAYLRFIGQDSALEIPYSSEEDLKLSFKREYTQIYGHWSENEEIEIESLRVISSSLEEKETKSPDLFDESYPEPKYNIPSYSRGK